MFDSPAAGPREAWQRALAAYDDTFGTPRALTVAWAARLRSTSAAVRTLWAEVFERWVQRWATSIEAEGARGAAPVGPAARDLAIAFTSMNERVIYASLSGDGPAVADEDVVPVLPRAWLTAVYGDQPH